MGSLNTLACTTRCIHKDLVLTCTLAADQRKENNAFPVVTGVHLKGEGKKINNKTTQHKSVCEMSVYVLRLLRNASVPVLLSVPRMEGTGEASSLRM